MKHLSLLLLTVLVGNTLFGDVRLVPDKNISAIARMAEPLSIDNLIRAALIASGTADEHLSAYQNTLKAWLQQAPPGTGDAYNEGDMLLQWLHSELLSEYVEKQTRLDVLLDNGRYNCVSSAVLYMILMRSRGIAVHGVLTKDHVFCRLAYSGDDGIDVETTIPLGFDPGRRREAVDSFTGRTGYTYVPPGNYHLRTDIGERTLISLIYANRMAELQQHAKWEDTVGLALDSWILAGTEAARQDFIASLNNLAAQADRDGRNEEVLGILASASQMFDIQEELRQNAAGLFNNSITRFMRSGRIEEALNFIEKPENSALIPKEFVEEKRREIGLFHVEDIVQTKDFESGIKAVDDAWTSGILSFERWSELSLYLWSHEAGRQSSGDKWQDGWLFLLSAPQQVQKIPQWDELFNSYAHNAAVSWHNSFLEALNKQQWTQARQILKSAFENFPDNQMLLKDRKILEERSTGQ